MECGPLHDLYHHWYSFDCPTYSEAAHTPPLPVITQCVNKILVKQDLVDLEEMVATKMFSLILLTNFQSNVKRKIPCMLLVHLSKVMCV